MAKSEFSRFTNLTTDEQNQVNSIVDEYRSIDNLPTDGFNATPDLLTKVEKKLQQQLLYELLVEEQQFLAQIGVQHSLEPLSDRFPDHKDVIAAIIDDKQPTQFPIDVHSWINSPESVSEIQFGKFQLQKVVGQGQFGAVFEAKDSELDRLVAIKLPKNTTIGIDYTKLVNEARNAAAVSHQNIVPIYEAGFVGGTFFVASQLIDGKNLRELLVDSKLTTRQCIEIVRDLSAAIAYAHQRGIVHNDIKPENILIDEFGAPQLTDFGLARSAETYFESVNGGSLAYAAPERITQSKGKHDSRSDIWSLGVLLFELIHGQRPFSGNSESEILQKLRDYSSVDELRNFSWPGKDVESICLKCLQPKPAERYESSGKLHSVLNSYLEGKEVSTRPIKLFERMLRWMRRNPKLALASAAIISLLTILAVGGVSFSVVSNSQTNKLEIANADLDETLQSAIDSIRDAELMVAGSMDFLSGIPDTEDQQISLYERALGRLENLKLKYGRKIEVAEWQAKAWNDLGNTYQNVGRLKDAVSAYQTSIDIVNNSPAELKKADSLELLGTNYMDRSNSFAALGDRKKAREATKIATKHFEEFRKMSDDKFMAINKIASCRNQLAGLVDDKEEQLKLHREAVDLSAKLKTDPRFFEKIYFARDYAISVHNLGLKLRQIGEFEEAILRLEDAISIRKQILEIQPKYMEVRFQLASSKNLLSRSLRSKGNIKQAEIEIDEAVEMIEKLADENPKVIEFGLEAVNTRVVRHFGQPPQVAAKSLGTAETRISKLLKTTKEENQDVLIMAGKFYGFFASFLAKRGDFIQSDLHFDNARKYLAILCTKQPENPQSILLIGSTFVSFARTQFELKKYTRTIMTIEILQKTESELPASVTSNEIWENQKSLVYELAYAANLNLGDKKKANDAIGQAIKFASDPNRRKKLEELFNSR